MTFYLKCPECDLWRSHVIDESYRSMVYRLDCIRQYESHYRNRHAPIPLPEIINQGETQ